jgi:hypothetical protein
MKIKKWWSSKISYNTRSLIYVVITTVAIYLVMSASSTIASWITLITLLWGFSSLTTWIADLLSELFDVPMLSKEQGIPLTV